VVHAGDLVPAGTVLVTPAVRQKKNFEEIFICTNNIKKRNVPYIVQYNLNRSKLSKA